MEDLKKQIKVAVDALKSRRFKEAENLTKKLISENTNIAFLYNLLGLILIQQEKFDEALKYYNKGIEVDPNFAMIYNNLGLLYSHQKNDNKKAEEYYKKSIKLDQKIPEPYNNLAAIYKSDDRFEEAIKCYNKSIEINPKFVHAYHNLGNIYTTLGDFEQAKKNFERAIEINPNYTTSHRTLSRLIKYTEKDPHFLKLKDLYNKINIKSEKDHIDFGKDPSNVSQYADLDSLNKINLGFALGKAYEDIKNYDESFKFYDEANTLFSRKTNFSMDKEIKRFENVKKTFNAKLYEKYKDCGSNNSSAIFILGMPRSGTTLVEQILSSHPDVFGGDEQIFIPNLLRKNFGNRDLKLYFENIIEFDKEKFKSIGEDYISYMKNISKNSKRFTDKFPENFFWIGFIKLILPKSKIIHCNRNSRDNCLSLFKNHFPSGRMDYCYNLEMIVEYYNHYYDLMSHWSNLLPNFLYNVKYENLISNTEKEINKLLKFCELPWNNKCLNFHDNKRIVKTASDVQARNKIYSSSIDSWKKYEKFLKDKFEKLKS
tara:strand:- start:31 stop:1656 length:1626 start_codon:yes stop_codon:yes gene_type:complete